MSKKQVMAEIIRHTSLSDGIFDMTLKAEEIAKEAKAGQFISVYLNNKSKILPRPISICGIDKEAGTLRIVYRTVGDGTKELSDYKEGEMVKILGPLGNGFTQKDKKAILIGGGIGIPPMLELMKQLDCDKTAVLGYRDSDMFLKDEFEAVGDVVISTEDGSFGTKGNVIDAIKEQGVEGSIIYACGPTPMLRGIKAYAEEMGVNVVIAVSDQAGRPVAVQCMDDAYIASFDIALNKTFTSASLKMSTEELSHLSQPGQSLYGIQFTNQGKIVIFGGGEPLKADGKIIGALGVSGGSAEEDTAIAAYGKEIFEEVLACL